MGTLLHACIFSSAPCAAPRPAAPLDATTLPSTSGPDCHHHRATGLPAAGTRRTRAHLRHAHPRRRWTDCLVTLHRYGGGSGCDGDYRARPTAAADTCLSCGALPSPLLLRRLLDQVHGGPGSRSAAAPGGGNSSSSSRHHHHVRCMAAPHKGRVGVYQREGNVSLASFGIKAKRNAKRSLSEMLPFVVVATAVIALTHPTSFAWVTKDYYAPALGGIMLSIGVQLSFSDFLVVFQRPLSVLVGYVGQYAVKPLLGYGVARAFNVSPAFAAGLILTSCVAGAQLSSYAVLLSGGDVALAIVLTSLTTMTSVVVTPLLTRLLIGSMVPVDILQMGTSILQVVICPVLVGLLLNTYAPALVHIIRPFMPLVAMVCTSLCIGSPLALNRDRVLSAEGLQLLPPVIVFHLAAFFMGYLIAKFFLRQDEKVSRTISLCTGMQSSTLAMLLATQFFGTSHAVPPACSVVIMAVTGLSLASFWGRSRATEKVAADGLTGYDGTMSYCRTASSALQ